MNYIDNIGDVIRHSVRNSRKKQKIIDACDSLIKIREVSIDNIRKGIKEIENQIEIWKVDGKSGLQDDYREQIELFSTIADFFKINGRFALIELDINTAYKYLYTVKDEYEYRFFARRIYTLIYETKKGLLLPVGKIFKQLESLVDDKCLVLYKQEHSKLTAFLNAHQDELKQVRNTNEAHKSEAFGAQVESIEKFSVARSIGIIQEYYQLLSNMNVAFMMIFEGLFVSLGETTHDFFQKKKSIVH